jgi:hypothetical protein
MAVTDLQVATLRALLTGEFDHGRRLMGQIGDDGLRYGYFPLVTAAFLEAAKQRFRGKKRDDIVQWVAETRAQRDEHGELDPRLAERLLLWVFGKASIEDVDAAASDVHQATLLTVLVSEQQFDDAGLDAFLQEARETVDTAMSNREE